MIQLYTYATNKLMQISN